MRARRKKGVIEIRHNDADRAGSSVAQRTRGLIGPVVEGCYGVVTPRARLLRYRSALLQRARNGHQSNTSQLCNVAHPSLGLHFYPFPERQILAHVLWSFRGEGGAEALSMRSSWRYFPLQSSRIPRRHLSGHEPIMRFISIRSTIGLLEQRRVCTPLNIDGIAHHKSVFGHYLQAAGASLRRWLNHLSEHLPQCCFTAHHLAIWTKELHILRKLRHQARPVTARERGHML